MVIKVTTLRSKFKGKFLSCITNKMKKKVSLGSLEQCHRRTYFVFLKNLSVDGLLNIHFGKRHVLPDVFLDLDSNYVGFFFFPRTAGSN